MDQRTKFAIVIVIILGLDIFSIGMGEMGKDSPMKVSELFSTKLLGERVRVNGYVSNVLPEYISKRGYRYQQFYLSDGIESIKVFCSEKYGKTNVTVGDEVVVEGTFQTYDGILEIYTFCSEVYRKR